MKHLESFSALGSLVLPSNSQCVLPPSMDTMPSFLSASKSTQAALLRPMTESHSKDLIDTLDQTRAKNADKVSSQRGRPLYLI